MKPKEKTNPVLVVPALIFGAIFKQAEFTKEQIELYFDLDYYFLKNVKEKNVVVKTMLRYHREFKRTVLKFY